MRGLGDVDAGVAGPAADIPALGDPDRVPAIDRAIRKRLAADLGDYVSLAAETPDLSDKGAFYTLTGQVNGEDFGEIALDVINDPILTAPVSHTMTPFCPVPIPGLTPGVRTLQNPADVLAGKLEGVDYNAEGPERDWQAKYMKHVNDLYQMVRHKTFDPRRAATAIAELSDRRGVPLWQLFPLQRLPKLHTKYRAMRKRLSPAEQLPPHIMSLDIAEITTALRPIIRLAESGDMGPALTAADIAEIVRNPWVPPGAPTRNSVPPVGSPDATPSPRIAPFLKRGVIPDSVGLNPHSVPPGQAGTHSGRGPSHSPSK
ncbi:MAG TPA: nucleotidyl transferase AbiEii/AbiGii toxin family protein [Mycobacteriales bacterium]|jgi:hypothetical protein|nr:nucleotidyl transferase AbiEii/AbiGii toxin family protein [Mycobacteriales bacterium]